MLPPDEFSIGRTALSAIHNSTAYKEDEIHDNVLLEDLERSEMVNSWQVKLRLIMWNKIFNNHITFLKEKKIHQNEIG